MYVEKASANNLKALVNLVLELWSDSSFDEEIGNYTKVIDADDQICFLFKDKEDYIAFIHVSTRYDYVEGSDSLPVAYVEGIYAQPSFRCKGIARNLMEAAEQWAKGKGYSQLASDTGLSNADSIGFHKMVGFHEVGKLICFIKDIK